MSSENGFENKVHNMPFCEFPEWLLRSVGDANSIELPEGHNPQSYYRLMEDDNPIGFGKLRPTLSANLLKYGKNIGYEICRSARGKGYFKIFVCLSVARAKGLDIVLITVDDNNPASFKAVERDGGVLEKTIDESRYYWVYL